MSSRRSLRRRLKAQPNNVADSINGGATLEAALPFSAPEYEVRVGDVLDQLALMPDESVDAVITDPPYGLGFMGKQWDTGAVPFSPETWAAVLRVAKPGTHLLAFGGTRTFHRLTWAIENAGWEIRDCLSWLYGQGFPKSLDVSKAIDKAMGAKRQKVRIPADRVCNPKSINGGHGIDGGDRPWMREAAKRGYHEADGDTPATNLARRWQGWGTGLKPAWEPIILARKPLTGTVSSNVQAHGTGALNIDGCRIAGAPPSVPQPAFNSPTGTIFGFKTGEGRNGQMSSASGRWPANVALDEDAARTLNEQSGKLTAGVSRFFYTAKASSADRDRELGNTHPTVKPTTLMAWLVKLVAPPGGVVLDPFCGSGSTGVAAIREGLNFVGIDLVPEYAAIARARMNKAAKGAAQ